MEHYSMVYLTRPRSQLYKKEKQLEQLTRNKRSNPMEDSTLCYYQKTDNSHGGILSWTFHLFISRSKHNIHLKYISNPLMIMWKLPMHNHVIFFFC